MSAAVVWKLLSGRRTGAALLLVFAVAAIALACCGADQSLAHMRHGLSIGLVAAFAFFAVLGGTCGVCRMFRRTDASAATRWSGLPALVLHVGFACVLGGWAYNACVGEEDGYLRLRAGQEGRVAASETAHGFNLELLDFTIDRWEDTGTVRQYTSRAILREDGQNRAEPVEIAVNHPLARCGWWVYQSSFEELENPHTGRPLLFTILQCVNDVGLPAATVGGILLMLGALAFAVRDLRSVPSAFVASSARTMSRVCRILYGLVFAGAVAMLVHRCFATGHPPMQNLYEFLMCAAALIPALTAISRWIDHQDTLRVDVLLLALVMIPVGFVMDGETKRLMPALQSPFFVPHVGAYVLGYILLVRAALGAGRRLAGLGFFLLTVGLVLGAMWGKVCWGHWWQFDPKEMWSLATWFVYAAYFHLRPRLGARGRNAFLVAGAVLIVLTLTWINLSRIFTGMHSYA